MSDIQSLLDDATTRATLHPDPVGAVHARVRRRAARRASAVASGAAIAVVAGGAVVAADRGAERPVTPVAPATPPAPVPVAYDRSWRHQRDDLSAVAVSDEVDRVVALVSDHPDVFLGFSVRVTDGRNAYTFAMGRDVNRGEWADDIEAAVGDRPWQTTQCPRTTTEMDRAATEVLSAPWPSGAHVPREEHFGWRVSYAFPCGVVAMLSSTSIAPEDADYARVRWEGAVSLTPYLPRER